MNDLYDVFSCNAVTKSLAIYPQNSFFNKLGSLCNDLIPLTKEYMMAEITIGNFSKVFPNLNDILWDKQRPINQEIVTEIIQDLDSKSKDTQSVNQIVFIATVNHQNPKILDGQHRLCAMYRMDLSTTFLIQFTNFKD